MRGIPGAQRPRSLLAFRYKIAARTPLTTQAATSDLYPAEPQEVTRLAALPQVRSAFDWFRSQESKFARWQLEVAQIAAPPFGEAARAKWLAERLREIGLSEPDADEAGNVFGVLSGGG